MLPLSLKGVTVISLQEVPLQTSSFAHVISQNVAKSYLLNMESLWLNRHLHIHLHPKDWVGIFKVGGSTACDYYTILWSPNPEHYIEGLTVNFEN
uniref:SKICH domain-containing protein n=1 Tax=Neovison vison TaxID=452646 RepID=A0A8C7EKG2_NEOVI